MDGLVYLDYAATSAVRPPEVAEAAAAYLRDIGATPGRSAHRLSLDAGRLALRCRRHLAELFAVPGDPGRISFHLNATHALNVAILGTVRSGDTVVRTAYDHNAVRRPVAALRRFGVHEIVLRGSPGGGIDLDEAARALAGRATGAGAGPARLLVIPHVSNVLGIVLLVADLADLARGVGVLVLVDAAQSAGHLPVDVERLGADMLAFSGHKGLLGPQGTGGLWVRHGVEVDPLVRGGTGGDSMDDAMPPHHPDRLEAGTQNGPGIAGLLAGLEWLHRRGVGSLHRDTAALKARLRDRLETIPGITLRSPPAPDGAGIVTLTSERHAASELARLLDADFGVLARAGLHCAPETHALLGTAASGALRLSLGWATAADDVDRAAAALRELCGNAEPSGAVHPTRSQT